MISLGLSTLEYLKNFEDRVAKHKWNLSGIALGLTTGGAGALFLCEYSRFKPIVDTLAKILPQRVTNVAKTAGYVLIAIGVAAILYNVYQIYTKSSAEELKESGEGEKKEQGGDLLGVGSRT